jgi:transcriptional regulator with XRE-family HTH domain
MKKEVMMNKIKFGSIIKERRRILKINQEDLSEISEVALHTISDIESGKGNPTLQVMTKICGVLGLELSVRIKGEE